MTEKELDRLLMSMGVIEDSRAKKPGAGKKDIKKRTNQTNQTNQDNQAEAKKSAQTNTPAPRKTRKNKNAPQKAEAPVKAEERVKPKAEKKPMKAKKNAKPVPQSAEDRSAVASPLPKSPHTRAKESGKKQNKKRSEGASLRVMMLGGLQEIGKNITVLEYANDIIIVDCGMGFPDEDMPGVDLVIPDFTYLVQNASRVRAVLLTHGHEDHIGGVPYLLQQLSVPVYGTKLTLGILEKKLEEFKFVKKPVLKTVEAGETVYFGAFSVEFIHVNHSIADSSALAIYTPVGTVLHSGDFKLDVSPIDGKMIDLARLGQLGNDGVDLLLCESTNAERAGFTPSERIVGGSLEHIFLTHKKNRLVIATFSSNVHRVQQIIDASARHGRRVAVIGRSMVNVISAARELGYMDIPEGVLVDIADIKRFRPEDLTLVTTGSQGEPMSALYRMAFGEHDKVKLTPQDVVVISASAIPGNEKDVGKIINALVKNGIGVINDSDLHVHVSGHACKEELKLMHSLIRPKYFIPIHGEYRHLYAHKELAEYMGMPSDRIFVSEIGKVFEMNEEKAGFTGEVIPAGNVLVDGAGIGDVGSVVLRDRKHLAEDGLIVVTLVIDLYSKSLLSGPDIITRGFVYVKEAGDLIDEARDTVRHAVESALMNNVTDFKQIKDIVKETLTRFIFKKTKRRPMILPTLTEI